MFEMKWYVCAVLIELNHYKLDAVEHGSKTSKKNQKRAQKRSEARIEKLIHDGVIEQILEEKDPVKVLKKQLQEAKDNKVL
jgi:hypothetical protein